MKPDRILSSPSAVLLLAALLITASPAAAQEEAAPDLSAIVAMEESDLAGVVGRYSADREALLRRWDVAYSTVRRQRLSAFYEGWLQRLDEIDMEGLGLEGRIDHVLLRSELRYELELLKREGPYDVIYERYSLFSHAGMEYAREAGTPGLLEVDNTYKGVF